MDKNLADTQKSSIFATASLSYGVMVALQFLVLSVVVRIRLGQQRTAPCIREINTWRFLLHSFKQPAGFNMKASV
jgi:hypothetical protein